MPDTLPKDIPILLVDDSLTMRLTLRNVLTGVGYTAIEMAANGKEALVQLKAAKAADKPFKIMFLDWNMPEMDGFELLTICRSELALKDLAIVMLTAVSDQKKVAMALNAGASSYITKPVSGDVIVRKMEQLAGWFKQRNA